MSTPVLATVFDFSSIVIHPISTNSRGDKTAKVTDKNGNPVVLQLPPMTTFSGFGTLEKGGLVFHSIAVSLTDPTIRSKFVGLDEKVLDYIVANSQELKGKKMTKAVLVEAELFKPFVKVSKKTDKNYTPSLSLKVPCVKGVDGKPDTYRVKAYGVDRKPMAVNDISKGSIISAIVQLGNIWTGPMGVGCSMYFQQVKLESTGSLPECAFVDVAVPTAVAAAAAEDEEEYEDDDE